MWSAEVETWAVAVRAGEAKEGWAVAVGAWEAERDWAVAARVGEAARGLAAAGRVAATVEAMEALGADRRRIVAVLGPTIGAASYEVGPEFVARFTEADAGHKLHFKPSARTDHAMFDLPGFIGMRLQKAGVGAFEDLGLDTYAYPLRFFSYRRTTHLREPDYGRLVSAIALA